MDSGVVGLGVGGGDVVGDEGGGRKGEEAVGEAFGDPEEAVVLVVEEDGVVLAEGGGSLADIDGDVPDLALEAGDEFALGVWPLVVEAAEDVLAGLADVGLYDGDFESFGAEGGLVEEFEEVAAFVFKHPGGDNGEVGELVGSLDGHGSFA